MDKFFRALIERRIADAEKELDLIHTSVPATETAKGKLKACEGLLLTARASNDKYLYLSKVEKTQKRLRELRKEFAQQATNQFHTDYDRVYLQVLEKFLKKLEKSDVQVRTSLGEKKTT